MQDLDIMYDDLSDEQQQLYDCIGAAAYKAIVKEYGGMSIYVAKAESVMRSARDNKIRADYNGYNFKYLVNKYGLSERTIRCIVADVRKARQNAPISGQMSFDDIAEDIAEKE